MIFSPVLLLSVVSGFTSVMGMDFDMSKLGPARRYFRSEKPACPNDPIHKRVRPNRSNLTGGSCTKNILGDSCRGAKVSCCTNASGKKVCLRVSAFNKMMLRRKNRKNTSPPRVHPNIPELFEDSPVVSQSSNCPKSNTTTTADGNTVQECVDYYPLPDCSPDGECDQGRICCEDPCYTPSGDEDIPRYCYPDVEVEEPPPSASTALGISADPNSFECPTLDEVCTQHPEGCASEFRRRCPAYEKGSTPCLTNDDCGTLLGSKRVCCPDFCEGSESSLCMLHAGFVGAPPVVEMHNDAVIVPPTLPGRQCPAAEPNSCVSIVTTDGRIQDCTESEVCSDSSKECCKLSDCGVNDKALYCVDPVIGEELPQGCPVPYRAMPSSILDELCLENGCSGDAICCPLSQYGGTFCFTPTATAM